MRVPFLIERTVGPGRRIWSNIESVGAGVGAGAGNLSALQDAGGGERSGVGFARGQVVRAW